MLPIIRQQVQPAFRQADMQSQQPWIMAEQPGSPLVHVTTHPSLVMSHLHMPIIRLQLQTIIPFIMHEQEHIPPASIVQRFCIMARATASSHAQVIFIPPFMVSTVILHRGTIIMFGATGVVPVPGIPGAPMPGMPIPDRSIIIVLVIILTPLVTKPRTTARTG
jgi:Flavivirus DEAD domain